MNRGFAAVQANWPKRTAASRRESCSSPPVHAGIDRRWRQRPLWGTALRRAGKSLGDAETIEPERWPTALEAAVDSVVELGAAEPGDKTMVDALRPPERAAGPSPRFETRVEPAVVRIFPGGSLPVIALAASR